MFNYHVSSSHHPLDYEHVLRINVRTQPQPVIWKKITLYRNFFRNLNFKKIVNFFKRTCCISEFAQSNSVKAVSLRISLRSKIVIFNNRFVFCVAGFLKSFMIYFCSMSWLAGWFPLREMIMRTTVLHSVCLKKYKKN